jgi:hypothetical protein
VNPFAWALFAAVPLLFGLFWWLDYRWLSLHRDADETPPAQPPEDA